MREHQNKKKRIEEYQPQEQSSYKPEYKGQQSSYEPKQSSYEPKQSSYEPKQSSYEPNKSSYEPHKQEVEPYNPAGDSNAYEPDSPSKICYLIFLLT